MNQNRAKIQVNRVYNHGIPLIKGVRHDASFYYYDVYSKDGELIGENIAGKAVFLKEGFYDLFTSRIKCRLEFENPHGIIVDNLYIGREYFTERKILELTEYGVMVDKDTAPILIKDLINQESLITPKVTYDRLGWYEKDDVTAFLGLNRAIGIDACYVGGWDDVKKAGSRDKWINMVKEHVIGRPSLELALAIGFASTAIGFIKKIIPTLDYIMLHAVGNSSCGKSTVAELIVSMGSYPKISGKNRSMMMDYSSTEAALINTLSQISGMPCAIDEASLCSNKNKSLLIYQLSGGRERARLSANAELKESGFWDLVIFSTGEHDILDYCERNVGLYARYLSICLDYWTDSAEHSEAIKKIVSSNYGHITEDFAEFLLGFKENDKTNEIIVIYEYWRKYLENKFEDARKSSIITKRLSGNLAVLLTSLMLGAECIEINVDVESVADLLVSQCSMERLDETDIAESAYEVLMQEIVKQPDKILPMDNKNYPNTIWGVRFNNKKAKLPDGRQTNGSLLILTSVLENILRRNGFNDKNIILKEWRKEGILISHKDRFKSKHSININGTSAGAYEISVIYEKGHEAMKTFGTSPLAHKKVNLLSDDVMEEETYDDCLVNYDVINNQRYGGVINKRSKRTPSRTDGYTDS